MRMMTTAFAMLILAATTGCGGGGGGGGSSLPAPADVRSLTGAGPAAETAGAQNARSAGIFSRADSLVMSAIHGETNDPRLPSLRWPASCAGTACRFSDPGTGVSSTVRLSDLSFTSAPNNQSVGAKHGITLFRATGRTDEGVDFTTLGAWMAHSAFAVESNGFTATEGGQSARFEVRSGIAGGDLTGSPPAGSATWSGFMVGTLASGSGRDDRLQGDFELTYDMGAQTLDAEFSNIQNIDRLGAHSVSSARFTGVSVDSGGEFQAGATGNRIQGGFYGTGHIEAAGIFERSGMVGAFGARRQ